MRKQLIVEYKYPEDHWREYDRTMVPAWAELQESRARREHSVADVRVRKASDAKK